jgi:hypothetical protein
MGGPLSDEQVQLFADWVAAGAPENRTPHAVDGARAQR